MLNDLTSVKQIRNQTVQDYANIVQDKLSDILEKMMSDHSSQDARSSFQSEYTKIAIRAFKEGLLPSIKARVVTASAKTLDEIMRIAVEEAQFTSKEENFRANRFSTLTDSTLKVPYTPDDDSDVTSGQKMFAFRSTPNRNNVNPNSYRNNQFRNNTPLTNNYNQPHYRNGNAWSQSGYERPRYPNNYSTSNNFQRNNGNNPGFLNNERYGNMQNNYNPYVNMNPIIPNIATRSTRNSQFPPAKQSEKVQISLLQSPKNDTLEVGTGNPILSTIAKLD